MQNGNPTRKNDLQHAARPATCCPHLGISDDPHSWLSFPNPGNFCYYAKQPRSLTEVHQKFFCLSQNHNQCPVYQSSGDQPLPEAIVYKAQVEEKIDDPRRMEIAAAVLVLIGIILFSVLMNIRSQAGERAALMTAAAQTPTIDSLAIHLTQEAALPSATPVPPTATATHFPTWTPTATKTPNPTPTPEPTHFAEFGERFGANQEYVLYRLNDGESLENVAKAYETRAEVIRASNILIEGASVQPGTVLLLMPGVTDPSGLIKFKIVQVLVPTLPKHIAAQNNVPLEILVEYNQIDPERLVPGGRWLFFPVQ